MPGGIAQSRDARAADAVAAQIRHFQRRISLNQVGDFRRARVANAVGPQQEAAHDAAAAKRVGDGAAAPDAQTLLAQVKPPVRQKRAARKSDRLRHGLIVAQAIEERFQFLGRTWRHIRHMMNRADERRLIHEFATHFTRHGARSP